MAKAKVFIADDNADFRLWIKDFLHSHSDFEIVGEFENGEQLIEGTKKKIPDLFLMDVSMPLLNGLETTKALVESSPENKVIMISVFDIDEYKQAAYAAGACGYIIKKNLVKDLIPMMKSVLNQEQNDKM